MRSRRMPLFSESSSTKESAIGPAASSTDAGTGVGSNRQLPYWVDRRRCLAGKGRQGWWEDAGFEPCVLVVPRFPGADRVTCRDQNDLVSGRELHHLACGQERPCRLLARDHEMSEPGR